MAVFGVWSGGVNYTQGSHPEDLERFASIADAAAALQVRASHGGHFAQRFDYVNKPADTTLVPCADEGCHVFLYRTAESEEPFALLEVGPRGGIKRTNL